MVDFDKLRKKEIKTGIELRLYNSWRSFRYGKGKKIGNSIEWNEFDVFKNDMIESYIENSVLKRYDETKTFNKENCFWVSKENQAYQKLIQLEYNNETKTLIEWCNYYNLNYNGVRQRYFRNKKNYTNEQILFGIIKEKKHEIKDFKGLTDSQIKTKASKMISAYRCKDKKKGFECDLDIDWFIENIYNKECSYCDSKINIGCDRLDNSLGHIKINIVPCCYRCNTIKNSHFNFDQMRVIGQFIKLQGF